MKKIYVSASFFSIGLISGDAIIAYFKGTSFSDRLSITLGTIFFIWIFAWLNRHLEFKNPHELHQVKKKDYSIQVEQKEDESSLNFFKSKEKNS